MIGKNIIKNSQTRINPIQRILEFNRDPLVRQLMNQFETPSLFDVLEVSRREMSISAFLADLFREDGFHGMGSLPLMLLLEKVLERAKAQEQQDEELKQDFGIPNRYFFPALERSILARTLEPCNISAKTEVAFSDSNGNSGRTDIEIQCDIKPLLMHNGKKTTVKHLNIAVENKIYSGEQDQQTEKYFRHYDALLKNKAQGTHPRSQYNLYVYLTPLSDEEMLQPPMPNCACKHFVQINWNDILIGVVEPLLDQPELSARARFFLEEFRKSLGISFSDVITSDSSIKPGFQTTVLALGEGQKEKLIDFWKNYRDLISWAVDEKNRNADEEDAKEVNKRQYYTKGDGQGYTMSRMVQSAISEWGPQHRYDEIIDTFSIRQRANTNNIIAEVDGANADYFFMDQMIETLDDKKCVVYKVWSQHAFNSFIKKAENVGIRIEKYDPVTLSKDESALLLEFYDKNERLILAALETMRFRTPWCNGEDIDAPDVDLRDQLEATLRRIRLRKNRKA